MPRIVYDTDQLRPACVLLQAAMGGDPDVANLFHSEDWLVSPTKAMALYDVTPEQLQQLIHMTENRMPV